MPGKVQAKAEKKSPKKHIHVKKKNKKNLQKYFANSVCLLYLTDLRCPRNEFDIFVLMETIKNLIKN